MDGDSSKTKKLPLKYLTIASSGLLSALVGTIVYLTVRWNDRHNGQGVQQEQAHLVLVKAPDGQECVATGCVETSVRILENIDFSVKPCNDMYQFSCGNYDVKNPIKGESVFVQNYVNKYLKDLLNLISDLGSWTFSNTGTTPFDSVTWDLQTALLKMHKMSVWTLFQVDVVRRLREGAHGYPQSCILIMKEHWSALDAKLNAISDEQNEELIQLVVKHSGDPVVAKKKVN